MNGLQKKLFLLFLIACYSLHAQEFKDFTVAVFGGGQYHWYKNAPLDKYIDSYNNALLVQLKNPVPYLRPKAAYNFGGEIRFSICRIGIMAGKVRAESKAELRNGGERTFRLVMNEIDWYIDFMKPSEKKWKIGFTIGSHDQHATLFSKYKFNNGYTSHVTGGDGALSGIFRFRGEYIVSLGLRLERAFAKRFMFVLKAEYAKMGERISLLAHKDEMYNNILSGIQYNDGVPALYFPDDYNNTLNSNSYNVGFNAIYGPYRGIRISAHLNINLYKRNAK